MFAWVRRSRRGVTCALFALVSLFLACKTPQQTRVLTFTEVFGYDTDPALRGQRVQVNATVLYFDPLWRILFLQDSSQSVYLEPPANLELHAGDRLEITGITTDPGKLLEKPEFRVTSSGALPPPIDLSSASQFGDHGAAFVRLPAIVRWSGIRNGRATIEGYAGNARLTALLFPGTSEDLPRIGSEIRIAGVATVENDNQGRFREWRMLTPSARCIEILKPGPQEPFSLPLQSLGDLRDAQRGKLIHVSGKVRDQVSSLSFSEGSKVVPLNLRRPLHGDFASSEVVGFWSGSSIDDAMVRPTGQLLVRKGAIRTIAELKHLTVAEAYGARLVSVRGVITYSDPNWGLLFVQDKTGAVFVNTVGLNLRLKHGDLVDVSGLSAPGDYAPIIKDAAVSYVGHGTFPEPLVIDPIQSNLSSADSYWSTFHGVVHSVRASDGHTNLKLGAGEAAFNVQLPVQIDGTRFLDEDVSVRGALGIMFNDRRQAIGHQIFVPAPEFITILGSGGKPNPDSTIAKLRQYSPDFDEHHSVSIEGQVVLRSAPNTIFLQDETGTIRVRTVEPLELSLGDRVSARGFLRPGEYSPAIEDAVVTRQGQGPLPRAEAISAKGADEGRHDSQYVLMSGTLVAVRPAPKTVALVLDDHGTYFDVVGPAAPELASLRLGSEIEARGILQVVLDRTHVPYSIVGFNLAFDSPRAIRIRKLGPWLDVSRIRWAGILFALFASAAVLWATQLRRQVRNKTQQLQLSLQTQLKAQQFDRSRNQILESIARNAPLPESMERLALAVQEQIPEVVCAVLLPSDGKSFLAGKPAPVFIAPNLSEEAQHAPAFLAALNTGVRVQAAHIEAVEADLVPTLLEALRSSGDSFVAGHTTPVFSASGSVVGALILFSRTELPALSESLPQSVLQSACRIISLAQDHWQMHESLVYEARHDRLTGLPNRAVAEDRLDQALARAERRKKSFAVFCIDLDGFKAVNDRLGHDAGDQLLQTVALRLRSRIRHSDTLARMGGDEFLAIIDDCSTDAAAHSVAASLLSALKDSVTVEGRELPLGASIGIAMYPADGQNASQLRRNADQAMYRAKSAGGAQACFLSRVPASHPLAASKGQS